MAEWLYQVRRVEFPSQDNLDQDLEDVLKPFGQSGWELVQAIPGQASQGNAIYHLVFKTEKPLD